MMSTRTTRRPVTLSAVVGFLNENLAVDRIADSSLNGLQVGFADDGRNVSIKKIGLAVDASLTSFVLAKKVGCDLLIVHHGLFWSKDIPVTRGHYKRLEFLINNQLGLYAAHLPLDAHDELGHNIQIAKRLGLKDVQPFGKYHGKMIGFSGRFSKPVSQKLLLHRCESEFGAKCDFLAFGSKQIQTVGIVSGGGSSTMGEACAKGLDVLITGERVYSDYHLAKDSEMNVLYGGHYFTEIPGLLALRDVLQKKLSISCEFLGVEQ